MLRGEEAGASRVGVTQDKLGVQPTPHFSDVRMKGGLQNWLNAFSDPSGRAALATLCPTDSSGEDLANWVGTDVVL